MFYNDFSLSKMFDAFDVDKSGVIDQDEFLYGIVKLYFSKNLKNII